MYLRGSIIILLGDDLCCWGKQEVLGVEGLH